MTGKRWRLTALLIGLSVVGVVWWLWWVSENVFAFVLAAAVLGIFVLLWAMDVDEQPVCGKEVHAAVANYSTHVTHHCHLELGHAEPGRHECRCGLVEFPPKAATGAGSLQVVLDSVPGAA